MAQRSRGKLVAAEALSLVFFPLLRRTEQYVYRWLPSEHTSQFCKILTKFDLYQKKGLTRFKQFPCTAVATYPHTKESREASQTRCDELGGGRPFGQSIQEYTIDEERLEFGLPTTNKLSFCDSSIYSPWPYTGNINWQVCEIEENDSL